MQPLLHFHMIRGDQKISKEDSVNLALTWGKPSKAWRRDDFLKIALTMGKAQKGQWKMTFTFTCTGCRSYILCIFGKGVWEECWAKIRIFAWFCHFLHPHAAKPCETCMPTLAPDHVHHRQSTQCHHAFVFPERLATDTSSKSCCYSIVFWPRLLHRKDASRRHVILEDCRSLFAHLCHLHQSAIRYKLGVHFTIYVYIDMSSGSATTETLKSLKRLN